MDGHTRLQDLDPIPPRLRSPDHARGQSEIRQTVLPLGTEQLAEQSQEPVQGVDRLEVRIYCFLLPVDSDKIVHYQASLVQYIRSFHDNAHQLVPRK